MKYVKLRKKLSNIEIINKLHVCKTVIDNNKEAIDYWTNKNEKNLSGIDNFIFMQSGFKTVKEYVDDCKNRITYQVKRFDDLKSMLKGEEIK